MKNETSLECLKKSGKATSEIMRSVIKNFGGFLTEKQARNFINAETSKKGMKPSFKPMVISGKDSSNPHWYKNKNLSEGFCVIDLGASYKGWKTDMTRTIYIGKLGKQNVEKYKKVLETYKKSVKMAKSDEKISEICKNYREIIGEKNLKHALGHGVGRKIHQKPKFNEKNRKKIKKECAFTIEPGYYEKNLGGIRIEDTFYKTKKGKIIKLTHGKTGLKTINFINRKKIGIKK